VAYKDPEARRENDRKWREANKERKAEADRRWHEANRDRVSARKRAYYEANRALVVEQRRRWRVANHAYELLIQNIRRGRKSAARKRELIAQLESELKALTNG
jgi:hypothetical protein